MPVRRFWLLEKNITRLQAERDLRQLPIASAPNSQEGYRELTNRLSAEIGSVVTVNVLDRDADATSKLQRLSSLKQG